MRQKQFGPYRVQIYDEDKASDPDEFSIALFNKVETAIVYNEKFFQPSRLTVFTLDREVRPCEDARSYISIPFRSGDGVDRGYVSIHAWEEV